MKTTYFTHQLVPQDGTTIPEPFKNSIDNMIRSGRNSCNMSGEYYLIQHIHGDVYTLIKTNSHDVFRKIDTSNNVCVDLSNILSANEKIAFASFFIIKGAAVGFSHSIYSPRINKLGDMYDSFMLTRNANHNIIFSPISVDVSIQEAINFAHVGKIAFKLEKSTNMVQRMKTLFTCNVTFDDVESFEIKIIPKRSQNIKNTLTDISQALPAELIGMTISAKENIGDALTDMNLITSNAIYDIVDINSPSSIEAQMENNFTNNALLRQKGF
ncbi:hypothetical protein [Edwardsiella ictaluri]